jgi:hypothetical protein
MLYLYTCANGTTVRTILVTWYGTNDTGTRVRTRVRTYDTCIYKYHYLENDKTTTQLVPLVHMYYSIPGTMVPLRSKSTIQSTNMKSYYNTVLHLAIQTLIQTLDIGALEQIG